MEKQAGAVVFCPDRLGIHGAKDPKGLGHGGSLWALSRGIPKCQSWVEACTSSHFQVPRTPGCETHNSRGQDPRDGSLCSSRPTFEGPCLKTTYL